MKKTYSKPELKTRKIELGVFGDYGDSGGGGKVDPSPVVIIDDLQMHME